MGDSGKPTKIKYVQPEFSNMSNFADGLGLGPISRSVHYSIQCGLEKSQIESTRTRVDQLHLGPVIDPRNYGF